MSHRVAAQRAPQRVYPFLAGLEIWKERFAMSHKVAAQRAPADVQSGDG